LYKNAFQIIEVTQNTRNERRHMFDPFESLNIGVYATAPTVICGLQVLSGLIWNMRCEQTTQCRRTEVGRLDFASNSKDQQIQMGLL